MLMLAVGLVPLSVAHAQKPDREAVGKRLRMAVRAGELTAEQAKAMMAVLEKTAGAKRGGEARAYLAQLKKNLGAAIRSGKMTERQAAAKFNAAEKALKKKMAAGRGKEERGRAKKAQRPDRGEAYLLKVRKELGAAVRAGKISQEDAAKKYRSAEEGLKKRMAAGRRQRGPQRITREDFARAAAEIRKAVAAGRVSEKDARTRLEEMRKAMGERRDSDGRRRGTERSRRGDQRRRRGDERSRRGTEGRRRGDQRSRRRAEGRRDRDTRRSRGGRAAGMSREQIGAAIKRIEAAVRAGRLTREQARARIEAMRKQAAGGNRARGERPSGRRRAAEGRKRSERRDSDKRREAKKKKIDTTTIVI
jgi:hypothetical protein